VGRTATPGSGHAIWCDVVRSDFWSEVFLTIRKPLYKPISILTVKGNATISLKFLRLTVVGKIIDGKNALKFD
jgi:hypothetical protein